MGNNIDEIARAAGAVPAVDRDKQTLTDGSPVTDDHRELKENGQQKDYVVLSAEERSRGFVRPVRRSYRHLKCGGVTAMGRALAETYARDPYFYSGTFCCDCRAHFPIGDDGEFTATRMVNGGTVEVLTAQNELCRSSAGLEHSVPNAEVVSSNLADTTKI